MIRCQTWNPLKWQKISGIATICKEGFRMIYIDGHSMERNPTLKGMHIKFTKETNNPATFSTAKKESNTWGKAPSDIGNCMLDVQAREPYWNIYPNMNMHMWKLHILKILREMVSQLPCMHHFLQTCAKNPKEKFPSSRYHSKVQIHRKIPHNGLQSGSTE